VTLHNLDRLLSDAEVLGLKVDPDLGTIHLLPPIIDRAAFRIIQDDHPQRRARPSRYGRVSIHTGRNPGRRAHRATRVPRSGHPSARTGWRRVIGNQPEAQQPDTSLRPFNNPVTNGYGTVANAEVSSMASTYGAVSPLLVTENDIDMSPS